MDHAEKLFQQMLDLSMIEIDEGGLVEAVHPMLWKYRDADKAFMKLRRKRIRMCETQARKDIKRIKTRLERTLGELVELPPCLRTAVLVAEALIEARDALRPILGPEGFNEYYALAQRVQLMRLRALDLALRKPKTAAWGQFLFDAGAWETEQEFEEELEEIAQPWPEAPPLALVSA